MNYTQSIGDVVELQCIAKFIEMGYEVSIPYGNGAKYDFVADINGSFLRIQCKACSNPKIKNSTEYDTAAIRITTHSQTTNTQKTVKHLYTKEQIDYFATCYKGQVYLIPVEECSTMKTLRFQKPKNGNKYNKAEDYEIEKLIPYAKDLLQSKQEFEDRIKSSLSSVIEYYCSSCGKLISASSKKGLCKECYYKTTRKAARPTREELKNLIRNESFVSIANEYGVSDNAIRKWCDSYNLPRRKKDIQMFTEKDWEQI